MKWLAITTATLFLSLQAQAVTIQQYLLLAQQNPALAQIYTAGVLDATKNALWCSDQEPNLKVITDTVLEIVINISIDPNTPADLVIVPLLIQAAPCTGKPNV